LYFTDGRTDIVGIVEPDFYFHIIGKVFFYEFQSLVNIVNNIDMVRARLRNNYRSYHRYVVHFHYSAEVFRPQFGAANVANPDYLVESG